MARGGGSGEDGPTTRLGLLKEKGEDSRSVIMTCVVHGWSSYRTCGVLDLKPWGNENGERNSPATAQVRRMTDSSGEFQNTSYDNVYEATRTARPVAASL